MKANRDLDRVYELLEQFDFKDLPEKDRTCVLSEMSKKDYIDLRNTLKATETFFSDSGEPNLNDSLFNSIIHTKHKPGILIKILNQPVKLYQLAASIILILGIYTIKQYADTHDKNSALPVNDTIYIQKTDTVSSRLADTVRIIKEKIKDTSGKRDINTHIKLLSDAKYEFDSIKVIYPGDIDSIKGLTLNKDISNDTLFKN